VIALQTSTIVAVESYWTDFFACPLAVFERANTYVVQHAGMGEYRGIFLFRRKQALIISVPPADYSVYQARLACITAASFDDIASLTRQIPAIISRVIGPAWIGYADARTFSPHQSGAARLLIPADEPAFLRFREACPPLDWEYGGSVFGSRPLAGQFIDDTLVALAGYDLWGERIAHIAVVTHPAYRGRSYGTCVVSVLAETVLTQELTPQYRTLHANAPSIAIAAALGFVAYADSLAIRLA